MAGDPEAALLLVGLGVRQLSASPSSLAAVRRAVRAATRSDLERIAMASLRDASAADVRLRLRT
jgi:phosphoenolpyruvate-protein kinase (PTS system EI component)